MSKARVGTKKPTFRSNNKTDERKKDAPPSLNFLTKKAPYKGLSADSEEKHEPASDIDTIAMDSLKALDPKRPIREADIVDAGSTNSLTAITPIARLRAKRRQKA